MTLAADRDAGEEAWPIDRATPSTSKLPDPVISIIIPARNAADTIDDALRSLAAQRGVSWEAIVVDDGSTDATAATIDKWLAKDRRLRLIRRPTSQGVSAARNAGLAVARGAWVGFLDADDWLAQGALGRLLALARRNPDAAVVAGSAARVSKGGRTWPYPSRDLSDPFSVLSTHCALPIHSALVRRTVVRAAGGFDEALQSSEDWDLWQRIARAGHRFVQTRDLVALYRARPGSLSRNLPLAAEQGLLVMRQAHAPDDRIPPEAPHARGAPPDALGAHELYYVLWSACRDIAAGGDGLATAALLPREMQFDFEPSGLGELVASGMADMLACRPDELGARWPEFEPKLRAVLDQVYPDAARSRLKSLALGVVKARLNGGSLGEPDVLQLEYGPISLDTGADGFEVLQLRRRNSTLAAIALPVLAARSADDLAEAVARQLRRAPLTATTRAYQPWRKPAFWRTAVSAAFDLRRAGLRIHARKAARLAGFLRQRTRFAVAAGIGAALEHDLKRGAAHDEVSPHRVVVASLAAKARESQLPDQQSVAAAIGGRAADPESARSWDRFFRAEDPWNYGGSDYERLKYEDTLELIEPSPDASALELACAEGHFTARLARRVGCLLATDISTKALERAAARCDGLTNVSFRQLDFMRRPLPGRYDLIVCSEVLYYAGDRLADIARKLTAALNPGGLLVMAHANQIADEPDATGFDWGHDYGARSIGDSFADRPELRLEREIHRVLYRVQAFRKAAPSAEPRVERRQLDIPLEPAVARNVVWGGGESRIAAFASEATTRVPILMYHRVSPIAGAVELERYRTTPEAFAGQMAWLRRQGCWGVTPEELAEALERNRPLPGRPVMITFDDGYADFAEHAWPTLQKHDMRAVLFAVTDKAGGAADWDAARGPPAPLMPWSRIAELAREGLVVESHSVSHRPLTRLDVADVYREILGARAAIARHTGREPISICYPFGAVDPVVERVAEECGCRLGFATSPGVMSLADNPYRLPRMEISIDEDMASFQRKLGRAFG